jgi:indolepyruvate ferredoxin oxidoreductase
MTVTVREPGSRSGAAPGRATPPAARPAFPEPPDGLPAPRRIVPEDEFAMRITGIGGTGVVTVSQVVGTAAMLDGYRVRGLDQIGLSQKAGPVVSDLRLSRTLPTATNRLGEGQADCLLAFDQLVAASEKGLLTADPDRTTVVGSTTPTPTGAMITHPGIRLPSADALASRLARATRPEAQFWADASAITEDLFGSATTANIFVVGMAVQAGCLPVSAARIEEAIRLNGVAVDRNVAAFRWGRTFVERPEAVEEARRRTLAAVAPRETRPAAPLAPGVEDRLRRLAADPELEATLARFARELGAWGRPRDVLRWIGVVERVARAEEAVRPGSRRLTEVAAASLFKLMAYKDEYEVARLMLDPEANAEAREVAGEGGRIVWLLHPPLLRALGLRRKLAIGSWARPAIRLLARAKGLRGTPFDPFGRARVRRVERALPEEYVAALDRALERLGDESLDRVVELAALPDLVRGYEEIKLGNVERYRKELAAALSSLGLDPEGRA